MGGKRGTRFVPYIGRKLGDLICKFVEWKDRTFTNASILFYSRQQEETRRRTASGENHMRQFPKGHKDISFLMEVIHAQDSR